MTSSAATICKDARPEALPAAYTAEDSEYAYTAANGISGKGAIVGESGGACIWLGNRVQLLAPRTRNLGEWSLWRAAAINEPGWIVGTGIARPGSITDAFLLIPGSRLQSFEVLRCLAVCYSKPS